MNKPTLLPSKDVVTNVQVQTCLNIAQTLLPFLAQPEVDAANPHKPGGAIDGGARVAAEMTLVNCCNRLDTILTDNRRWDMDLHRLLEAQMVKVLSEQITFLQAQTEASKALNTPTHLHKPEIINAGNGDFVALLGDPDHPACLGVGKSPAEACTDFDRSFHGETTQNQLDWLAAHPDPEPTPKKRKKKQ